jgi:hypothetical protein
MTLWGHVRGRIGTPAHLFRERYPSFGGPERPRKLPGMDEGLPIAYQVLEADVPVYASGGEQIGTVDHVVAAPELDIFHGIVIHAGGGRRFVAAGQVASPHERGVDLSITEVEAGALPEPHGAAPVWHDSEPGIKPSGWRHFVDRLGGHSGRDGWAEDK